MKFTGDYLYRVRIVSYPEGSHEEVDYGGEKWTEPVEGWRPPGWRPRGNYTEILGTDEFVWPTTNQVYASRSTAKKRADLIESFGATAVVERSSRITWPEPEES
ncbi:hypothetical protein [Mycolicibacterium conceptionense]|uniref:hypothetical protein n=1 Tax=Mycolicibacterium conceptionense TaxID=451644 RepID=UPI0007ED06D2|nr:hypothetical protein [Mycolicibacterium conceptionense]OBK09048.1 hypothetical protein A5639_12005 [Mycolicibacterium conceptionense]